MCKIVKAVSSDIFYNYQVLTFGVILKLYLLSKCQHNNFFFFTKEKNSNVKSFQVQHLSDTWNIWNWIKSLYYCFMGRDEIECIF